MKVLLDQGLSRTTAELLRQAGHNAVHTGDIGMAAASDAEIISAARANQQMVVTLDTDFHAILARERARSSSVSDCACKACPPISCLTRFFT